MGLPFGVAHRRQNGEISGLSLPAKQFLARGEKVWREVTASHWQGNSRGLVQKLPARFEHRLRGYSRVSAPDLASVPFATFIANKKQSGDPASYSFVLRGYVRHWLDNVWAEYDRAGLIDIVEAKEPPRPTGWRLQPAGVPMSIEPPRGTGRK